MGMAMGADFSGVRVHTDAQSDQLNKSIQAKAFTTGQDVFFRQGEYNPGNRGGQELIAHELTHVVQQNGGAVQRSPLPQMQSKITPMLNPLIQRVVEAIEQPDTNLCWATVGYAIHKHKGGVLSDIGTFVNAKGSATSKTKFTRNEVCDIDEIIGSSSEENLFSGSDTTGSYQKGTITKATRINPIVANVNGNHYIIITQGELVGQDYQITYMDPADGSFKTENATVDTAKATASHVTGIEGGYSFTVFYYLK